MRVTVAQLKRRARTLRNKANADKLVRFIDEERHRVELSTINSRMDPIMAVGRHLGRRPWKALTRDDLVDVIANHISLQGAHLRGARPDRGKPLADSTKYQWSILLLFFYKWLLDTDDRPPQFRRLPFRKIDATAQRLKVLCLTPAEVRKLLSGARSKRDRAIIIVALEGSFRSSEMAALRLDSIDERNHGFWLTLDGEEPDLKTGPREVAIPIVAGQKVLREWLEEHPRRHGDRVPLFVTLSNRSFGRRMNGASISDVIRRCAKRAKLRKVHAHMLRHTATSFRVVRNVNPEVIRYVNGWTKRSTMLGYYTHAKPFFESMALESYGIRAPAELDILDVLGSQSCMLCGGKVDVTASECEGCGVPNADAIARAKSSRNREAALEFVAVELAFALGWQPARGRAPKEARDFLKAKYSEVEGGTADEDRFARWCLKRWAEAAAP